MIYVMSDIHGRYDEYKEMLAKINFSEDDSLFILGDAVDRGPKSMEILLDMCYAPNIFPIMGNHDVIALACLKEVSKEITDESVAEFIEAGEDIITMLTDWMFNLGGQATMDSYSRLSTDEKEMVLEYIEDMPLYEELVIGGKSYILAHTIGPENFYPDRALGTYNEVDLLHARCDYGMMYYKDKILITGHTATCTLEENGFQSKLYQGNNHIAMDCGMDRLGCLCLDTMEEYYVDCDVSGIVL